MSEFYWVPQYGAAVESTAKVRKVQFGDGYSQRRGDGINGIGQNWRLVFRGLTAEMAAIDAFLKGKAGVSSFTFTPAATLPEGRYICATWSYTKEAKGIDSINATFEQVFEV